MEENVKKILERLAKKIKSYENLAKTREKEDKFLEGVICGMCLASHEIGDYGEIRKLVAEEEKKTHHYS